MLIVFAAVSLIGAVPRACQFRTQPQPADGPATGLISGATAILYPVVYLQSLDFSKGRGGREDPTDITRATDDTMQKDALIQALGVTVLVASIGLALGLGARGELPLSVIALGIGTITALAGMVSGRAIRNRVARNLSPLGPDRPDLPRCGDGCAGGCVTSSTSLPETGDLLPERFRLRGSDVGRRRAGSSLHPASRRSPLTKRPPFAIMHPHKETSL